MRICFLADIRSIHTKRWIEYFASDNEIHLITLAYPSGEMGSVSLKDYENMNVKVHSLPRSFPSILFNSGRIQKLVRQIRPDLLHAHFVTHYGYWGARAGFHPFVVSAWGDDVLIHPKKIGLSFLVRHALCAADAITCDGENSLQAIRSLGIPQDKIHLITHGVDTRQFSPLKRKPELMEQVFGDRGSVVICIRGFNPLYDAETLIRAIPPVLAQEPQAHFIIAGKGFEEERIRTLVRVMGVESSIHFCGWIPHDRLPPYLASSDIYVSLSLSDGGVSISTFEAMASGLAVVVTDSGDNRRWIKDEINGFVIPVRSPALLAEKIVYLVLHPEARERSGAANRAIVETAQDYYKEMEKVHVLYNDLVKR